MATATDTHPGEDDQSAHQFPYEPKPQEPPEPVGPESVSGRLHLATVRCDHHALRIRSRAMSP